MQDYYQINIRTFAELLYRSGDITSSDRIPDPARALQGAKIHRKIQQDKKAENAAYVSERAVSYTVTDANQTTSFKLQGRADGFYYTESALVLDEIKTVEGLLPEGGAVPVHYAQAAVYAYILLRTVEMRDSARICILYVSAEQENECRCFETQVSFRELEQYFNDLCETYLSWLRLTAARFRQTYSEIQSLTFPFEHFRSGQRAVSVATYKTVTREEFTAALIQAPTGIGKTMGVLFPALKGLEPKEGTVHSKIFYLIARSEGARPAEQALSRISVSVPSLFAVTLTAKEKICPRKEKEESCICDGGSCPYAKGHYDRLPECLKEAWASSNYMMTRERILALSEAHQVCPFELSLDLSLFADVVIGDYNYLFDLNAYLRRFFEDGAMPFVFLLDEAHNLPDRVREMYTESISEKAFKNCSKSYPKTEIGRSASAISRALSALRRESQSISAGLTEVPAAFSRAIIRFCDACSSFFARGEALSAHDELRSRWLEAQQFRRIEELWDHHFRGFYEKDSSDNLKITLLCADPSGIIADRCSVGTAAVFFSATLLPEKHFTRALGFPEALYIQVPSPFPPENRLVLISGDIVTRYQKRAQYYPVVADFIAGLCRTSHPANYMVYFNSYEYLQQVVLLLPEEIKAFIVVQPRGADLAARQSFLEGFREDPAQVRVGLCVLGGSFAEGIDLPGERLSGVAIVGVGLPKVGTVRELIRDTLEVQEPGSGFEGAYLYPGLNKVIQAAGRVIRKADDRGFIALLDERYRKTSYLSQLPAQWQPTQCKSVHEVLSRIVDFFK